MVVAKVGGCSGPWKIIRPVGGTYTDSEIPMKKLMLMAVTLSAIALGSVARAADTAPKSVIHVVTVAWKEGTTPEQIKAALDGVRALPAEYKGITRVWTKPVKIQDAQGATVKKNHVIVMEFADEKALADYSESPAQLKWYKSYELIRQVSTTFDITN